jgi:molybdopterin-containing oxidoreductase family iron-sulfur binding subunit
MNPHSPATPPPSPHPDPNSGKARYWRCWEALKTTDPRIEFPPGAFETPDTVSRRHFFKIMMASLLLAGVGTSGCRRHDEVWNVPGTDPGYAPGEPQYFATAMASRRRAIPLRVKCIDGRPLKIEGNPDVPGFNGGTDLHAQALVLGLYDPDRADRFLVNQQPVTKSAALDFLSHAGNAFGDGHGLVFLTGQTNSPSRARLRAIMDKQWPAARWCEHEAVDFDNASTGATLALGTVVTPEPRPDRASAILSIDCDFLGTEENAATLATYYAQTRNPSPPGNTMSRLYCVESLMTLTGANADHRLAVPPSMLISVLARVAIEIFGAASPRLQSLSKLTALAAPAAQWEPWIVPCTRDLLATKQQGKAVILAGHRLPPEAHALVTALNEVLEANGSAVVHFPAPLPENLTPAQLIDRLKSDSVDTLVILGGNPAQQFPSESDWPAAQARAKNVFRWSLYEDETARIPGVHFFPAAHPLESWGDARQPDGVILAVQPLIDPLFDGITDLEFLARLAGLERVDPQSIVQETFQSLSNGGDEAWNRFLETGCFIDSTSSPILTPVQWDNVALAVASLALETPPSSDRLDIVFHRDAKIDDGRFVNNGWLQELPDPITHLTWDNAVLLSPGTAERLGLPRPTSGEQYPVVEIHLGEHSLRGPALVQPGMADNTLGLALGYGQPQTGNVGRGVGFNAYALRRLDSPHFASGATLRQTGESQLLARTQHHWLLEDHTVIREFKLEQLREMTESQSMLQPEPARPKTAPSAANSSGHQWAMAIDLARCIGCSACVIACQSENNIPIVGRDMVAQSREMHWLRIDRYYTGSAAAPRTLAQPMLCQHCEAAPCEAVCPVNATVHDTEGLNVMVYNRCIGSRFCSNNCPFKARRFNFFDYNRNPLNQLTVSPLAHQDNGQWRFARWIADRDRGNLPAREFELGRMAKNPDVTVRMRGVMEKCTFCQQRIQHARETQKIRAGNSSVTPIPTSEIPQTACQQACPTKAIRFGNMLDSQDEIASIKAHPRRFEALNNLGLKPRVSYLAPVRNLNPAMPDAKGGM